MYRATKRTYHNDKIARNIDKPAKIWESMKEIIFDNKTKLALNVNEEVADEYNLYFTKAAASLRPQQLTVNDEDNQFYETTTPLTLGPITQEVVSNIIKGLNNKSANGPDDVCEAFKEIWRKPQPYYREPHQ
jgi:hypothetical protein